MTRILLAACLLSSCLWFQPAPLRAHTLRRPASALQSAAARGARTAPASPAWWREGKKRFHQLALCALASANVTYTLLVGFSGVGAAIGFTAALLGVVMCL